jgi:hypothetical protein
MSPSTVARGGLAINSTQAPDATAWPTQKSSDAFFRNDSTEDYYYNDPQAFAYPTWYTGVMTITFIISFVAGFLNILTIIALAR